MAVAMTSFTDKAANKLAENRSALSTPNTRTVAKCSRLTPSGQSTFPDQVLLETRIDDWALVDERRDLGKLFRKTAHFAASLANVLVREMLVM